MFAEDSFQRSAVIASCVNNDPLLGGVNVLPASDLHPLPRFKIFCRTKKCSGSNVHTI